MAESSIPAPVAEHESFVIEDPPPGPPPTRPTIRALIRQNSEKVANFAEVVLPKSDRSVRGQSPAPVAPAVAAPAPGIQFRTAPAPRKQYPVKEFPIFMVLISLLEILIYNFAPDDIWLYLGYDPYRRHELWRFLTILLVHSSKSHLYSNVIFQFIVGVLLEIIHHWKRVAIIYIGGVLGGSLFVTVLQPTSYAVGASAGVYALLFAHLATIILNWNEMDKKCCRLFWLLFYIAFDVGITVLSDVYLKRPQTVSHAGHLGGAITGFLTSILVLKNFEKHPWELKLQRISKIILIALFVVIVIINIAWPSHYLDSEFNTNYEESFLKLAFQRLEDDPELVKECEMDDDCLEVLKLYRNMTRTKN